MAASMRRAQTILLCQLCELESNLQVKCIDCDLLMCKKMSPESSSQIQTCKRTQDY